MENILTKNDPFAKKFKLDNEEIEFLNGIEKQKEQGKLKSVSNEKEIIEAMQKAIKNKGKALDNKIISSDLDNLKQDLANHGVRDQEQAISVFKSFLESKALLKA